MEKDPQPNDFTAKFLADMEAKYAALGNAIASVRTALSIGALGNLGATLGSEPVNAPTGPTPPGGLASLPRGAFLRKSASEAIKMYLGAVRKKQTNKEISQALKEGGLESTGNFDNYITGALFRLKKENAVLRFEDGWGLAEWYPESFRVRVEEKTVTVKKKKKKPLAKARTDKGAKPKTPVIGQEPETQPKQKPQSLIEDYFAAHSGVELSTEEIATGMGMRIQTVGLICAKLAHEGKVEKTSSGKFSLFKGQQMPKAS